MNGSDKTFSNDSIWTRPRVGSRHVGSFTNEHGRGPQSTGGLLCGLTRARAGGRRAAPNSRTMAVSCLPRRPPTSDDRQGPLLATAADPPSFRGRGREARRRTTTKSSRIMLSSPPSANPPNPPHAELLFVRQGAAGHLRHHAPTPDLHYVLNGLRGEGPASSAHPPRPRRGRVTQRRQEKQDRCAASPPLLPTPTNASRSLWPASQRRRLPLQPFETHRRVLRVLRSAMSGSRPPSHYATATGTGGSARTRV